MYCVVVALRYIGSLALDLSSHPGGLLLHLERSRTSTLSRLVVSRQSGDLLYLYFRL